MTVLSALAEERKVAARARHPALLRDQEEIAAAYAKVGNPNWKPLTEAGKPCDR
jgi:hypothetical protein